MKRYKLYYILLGILFLLATSAAYINFAAHSKPGFRYTGANPYAAADKLVYKSLIQQGREGYVLMRNQHTIEPQKGLLLSPHWYVIGQTARLFGISNNASYQLYRVLLTVVFLWMLYAVLLKLFINERDRLFAAFFVLFSGGLGWFFVSLNQQVITATGQMKFLFLPVDIYVTEGNTLLNFSQAPLFILTQLMLVGIFYFFIVQRNVRSDLSYYFLAAAVAVLGIIHPYDLPILFAVLGSWSVWRLYTSRDWRVMRRLAIVLTAGLVAGLYNFYIVIVDPVLLEWLKQNLVYSPPIRNYLWGYGLLIPLWLVGAAQIFKQRKADPWWAMLFIWSTVVWILLYLPFDVSRRFINGWHIAMALVAFFGFRYLYQLIQRRWLRIAYTVAVSVTLVSSISFYLFVSLFFSSSAYTIGYYYVTSDEERVIAYLQQESGFSDTLLTSDPKTAFTLTSEVNRLVFRGHDHQTPRSHLKQQQLDWFFSEPAGERAIDRRQKFVFDNQFAIIVVNNTRLDRPVIWLDEVVFAEKVLETSTIDVYRVTS